MKPNNFGAYYLRKVILVSHVIGANDVGLGA